MPNKTTSHLIIVAGWCAFASGFVAAIGVAFLLLFYIGFLTNDLALQRFGPLNDICIIIQYLLALPILLALYQLFRILAPVLSAIATLFGIVGIFAVVILQYLLLVGSLTFNEQVGPVVVALFAIGVWMVITGYLGSSTGKLPRALSFSILGALYLGFPVWAIWLGRRLVSGTVTSGVKVTFKRGETA